MLISVDDGTGSNTLAISAPGTGNCGTPSANQHTGNLSLTNLNAYGNITLNGATSGSSVLSVTATGGTLNLGSTNAMVDSSGDISGVSATFTTPANSSLVPLTVSQGALSTSFPLAALSITSEDDGATNVPALSIAETWNDTTNRLAGPALSLSVTNTSSAPSSKVMQILVGGSPIFNVTPTGIVQSAEYGALTNASTANFCGGVCTGTLTNVEGGAIFQGMDNSNTVSATAGGGFGILRGGMLTGASITAGAVEGVVQVGEGYCESCSVIAAVGDVVCGTATAFTVTDCATSASNIIGIATITSNPIGVVSYGLAIVKLDNASTVGHTVCMSTTTVGEGHDNVLAACAAGGAIGVVVANSGNVIGMSGNTTTSFAMGSTLPLVQLHISQ